MKSRSWILILCLCFLISGLLGICLMHPGQASLRAEIYSGGKLIKAIDLQKPQVFTVTSSEGGTNTITVQDGAIAVTDATCPDHYCMHRGFCSSGAPIICLPNGLEIRFVSPSGPDFSIG